LAVRELATIVAGALRAAVLFAVVPRVTVFGVSDCSAVLFGGAFLAVTFFAAPRAGGFLATRRGVGSFLLGASFDGAFLAVITIKPPTRGSERLRLERKLTEWQRA
jgi:hypothetical protein